jgi:hypothetical protein
VSGGRFHSGRCRRAWIIIHVIVVLGNAGPGAARTAAGRLQSGLFGMHTRACLSVSPCSGTTCQFMCFCSCFCSRQPSTPAMTISSMGMATGSVQTPMSNWGSVASAAAPPIPGAPPVRAQRVGSASPATRRPLTVNSNPPQRYSSFVCKSIGH